MWLGPGPGGQALEDGCCGHGAFAKRVREKQGRGKQMWFLGPAGRRRGPLPWQRREPLEFGRQEQAPSWEPTLLVGTGCLQCGDSGPRLLPAWALPPSGLLLTTDGMESTGVGGPGNGPPSCSEAGRVGRMCSQKQQTARAWGRLATPKAGDQDESKAICAQGHPWKSSHEARLHAPEHTCACQHRDKFQKNIRLTEDGGPPGPRGQGDPRVSEA